MAPPHPRTGAGADPRAGGAGCRERHSLRQGTTLLTSTLVYGGVSIAAQVEALNAGVDILIATPGRLLDHLRQGRSRWQNCAIWCLTRRTGCSTWALWTRSRRC